MTLRTAVLVPVILLIAGCGSSTSDTAPSAPASSLPSASAAPSGGFSVTVADKGSMAKVLTGADGLTLYYFMPDAAGKPTCNGGCAQTWPPLVTAGTSVPADPRVTGAVGTATRADGTVQVTYNGWPLYRYSKDKAADDTQGEGVGGVWHVAKVDIPASATKLPAVTSAAAAATAAPANGY